VHLEVEQKYPLADVAAVEQRLAALGAQAGDTLEQVDRYFNHPARDFAQTDEALRLRCVGQENFITYKGPKLDATTKTRQEIELPLPPGSSAATAHATLLEALGFKPVAAVRKQRRLFHIDWEGKTVEVALDDVTEVGKFLELEISADETTVEAAKACLASLATRLGLVKTERQSYLELLLAHRAGN
jgi:adenylate cyclase, class 2